jgi:IclR family KDG regulon transcriptional repressor
VVQSKKTGSDSRESGSFQRSALHSGLDVLELLSRRSPLNLTEISDGLGRSKSGMHAILNTLRERSFVEREAGGRYRLGTRAWEMGQASFSFEIRQIAKPHLEKLAQRTGEGVILGVLDGFDVVYLSVFQGNHPVRVDVQLGERQPANLTSTGVALLAALDDDRITALMPEVFKVRNEKSIRSREELWQAIKLARASGVGLMKGGWHIDVGGVAQCVRNGQGNVVAAICVSAPLYRVDESWLSSVRTEMGYTVRGIEDSLEENRPA